jgi:hypothetical protein
MILSLSGELGNLQSERYWADDGLATPQWSRDNVATQYEYSLDASSR